MTRFFVWFDQKKRFAPPLLLWLIVAREQKSSDRKVCGVCKASAPQGRHTTVTDLQLHTSARSSRALARLHRALCELRDELGRFKQLIPRDQPEMATLALERLNPLLDMLSAAIHKYETPAAGRAPPPAGGARPPAARSPVPV